MKSKARIVTRILWPFCVAFIAIGYSPRIQFKEVFSLPKPIPAPVTTLTEVRANLKELYPQLDFDDPLVHRDFEPLYKENWGTLCYRDGDDGCGTGEAIFLGIVAGVVTVFKTPKRQVSSMA